MKQADQPGSAITMLESDFGAANHYVAIALSAKGNWEEAEHAFEAAVRADPRDAEVHFNYGVALRKQSLWQNAATEFAESSRLRPFHPQARCELALALKHLGRLAEAQQEFTNAKEVGPCPLDVP